jgi:FkbM family methyltransferase
MKQRAIQALVTDTNGKEYEFHVSNNDGQSSSILNLKDHRDIWPSVDFTKTLTLQGSTLPTLLKDQGIDVAQYQALVMDTQGSELLILRGAISILSRFEYIKLEVPDFESYEGCCQLNDVNAFMVSHKYKEHSRKKFASRKEGGSYFDVVFKRQG